MRTYEPGHIDLRLFSSEIVGYLKEIDGAAIKLGFDFTNKIGGLGNRSNNVYASRDSLLYRLGSIRYHLDEYIAFRTNIENQLQAAGNFVVSPMDAERVTRRYSYRFDDIIFNLVSFLDYLGKLIAVTINKGKINDWPGLIKAARSKSGNDFNRLKVSQPLLEFDKEMAAKLYEYRSELIHEKAHTVSYILTHKSHNPDEIRPFTPTGFVTKFHELRKLKKSASEVLLDNTIRWLILNFFEQVIKVMKVIMDDIEDLRTIEKGKEIFTFGP